MYHALYRKWRPKTFDDVIGQKAIVTALSNQILAGRVAHAYLFTGTRGTGKTSCAKIFAKAVNCENPNGANPCGACVPCEGLDSGSILDVIEIDAASNNGVDDIRSLRDETAYRPSRCKYKVYIIDEVHMLSTAAFNALLKIMEEPPSHIIFILATTELHKVPATILSRCQRYDFMRITVEDITKRLLLVAVEENIELSKSAAGLIARLADGAMRDALSLLDTCAGTGEAVDEALVRRMAGVADKSYLFSVSDAVYAQNVPKLLELVASLREKSIDVKRLTEELVYHYRAMLLAAAGKSKVLLQDFPPEEQEKYLEDAAKIGEEFAIHAVRRLASAMDNMARAPDPRIELELALFDLCVPQAKTATSASAAASASLPTQKLNIQPQKTPVEQVPFEMKEPPTQNKSLPLVEIPLKENSAPQAKDEKQAPTKETPSEETSQTKVPLFNITNPSIQQTPTDETPVPFIAWPQVVEQMAKTDRMLFSFMKESTAFYDGKRVLISGGDMFLSFMREYDEASDKIKASIEQVTGTRYAIGPYSGLAEAGKKQITAKDTLQDWHEKGIPIEYE